jgi:tRNA nucleotidyltransferase (CCA-adding enzyme)
MSEILSAPAAVLAVLERLEQAGFAAFVVGGAVRSQLQGKQPHDYDVCTAARPEQIRTLFAEQHPIDTGAKHGTVTVLTEHGPVEITTFRTEGQYSDCRRPDSVAFVTRIEDDLARRDFTMNAMAWSPRRGLCDPFGGQRDLQNGILRCVGDPEQRMREDALRILRALRFAASDGFQLEEQTERAVLSACGLLHHISAERITDELLQILCAPHAGRILTAYADVITEILPELRPMIGFNQNNPHHRYTLWEHSVRALESIAPQPALRLAMLFHDVGKSVCYTEDAAGIGHFYGHAKHSLPLTAAALQRLRLENALYDDVLYLVRHHDTPLGQTIASVRRKLAVHGETYYRSLLAIHKADCIGQGKTPENLTALLQSESLLETILEEEGRFHRKDLAVNGRDLLAWGLRGPAIGEMLAALLNYVLDEPSRNTRDALYEQFCVLQNERNRIEFTVSGMSWRHCAHEVQQLLESIPAVQYVKVDLPSGRVEAAGTHISLSEIRQVLADAGYEVAI